ncbi:nucleotidyltransferase family protein [Sediminicoccus rosea]|uniref:Nucleotidyltransferase family protein n=1 Tax=Sediminicoccus rosea TaxID=1225128 RepID=A0ABZ0PCN1_9PROT|nr:nucleotidyltransferase family protein [Sediminicoccus rosea]WPB82960.1 nucleotidyltransferase family protein [Sediminicoccus rosea]
MELVAQHYWPDRADTLLLMTALHPDEERARTAWRAWEEMQRFETANWAKLRIFPVVARRLPQLGLDSELLPRLAGVRRFLWTKTRLLHRTVAPLLEGLRAAGITPMLTKGAARVALDPAAAAERYSHDVDVLVPTAAWEAAVDVMYAHGMEAAQKLTREQVLQIRHRFHGIGFGKAEAQLDLHFFALKRNRCEGDDDGLWARAQAGSFVGVPVLAPSAEDRLVMALAHGLLVSPGRVTDWVFDAVAALSVSGFDWKHVQRELIRRGLSAFGMVGLRFLRERLAQPVPTALIAALRADTSQVFAEEFNCLHETYWARTEREHALLTLADYERARRAAMALPAGAPQGRRGTPWADAALDPPTRARAGDAVIPVPPWISRGDRPKLDLTVQLPQPQKGQRLMLELTCFAAHQTSLQQRFVAVAEGRAALRFVLPADFMAMRRPDRLALRAWGVDATSGATRVPVLAARHRWRSS